MDGLGAYTDHISSVEFLFCLKKNKKKKTLFSQTGEFWLDHHDLLHFSHEWRLGLCPLYACNADSLIEVVK